MPKATPKRIRDSDGSDSGEEYGSPSPRPAARNKTLTKDVPLPSLDLSHLESQGRPSRTRRESKKKQENTKDAVNAKDAKIAQLMKQLKNSKKKEERTAAELHKRDVNKAPAESEEEDEEPVEMSSYSAAFISKGIVGETAVKPLPKKLRRSGEAQIMTPLSRTPLTNIGNKSNAASEGGNGSQGTYDEQEDMSDDPSLQPTKQQRSSSPSRSSSAFRHRQDPASPGGYDEQENMFEDPSPKPRKQQRSSSPSRSSSTFRRRQDPISPGGNGEQEDMLNGPSPRPLRSLKRRRSLSPSKKARKRSKATKVTLVLRKAEFVAGKAPTGSRTNLKDYTEPAARLLKRAMHRYEVRIWTLNPFPGADLQEEWVKEIWDEVCTEAEERMELTVRMAGMIKKYGSHARSTLKDGVRPLVAPTYKFTVGDTPEIISANIKLWKALLEESAFHYKAFQEPLSRTGFAGNTIIMGGLRGIWFRTKAGRGVIYSEYFSPITLVTLALLFTAIEFCIDEYSSGRFQQANFDEIVNKDRYDVHLRDLTDWAGLMPPVTTSIRQQMHDSCRASTGAAVIKAAGRLTEGNRARALLELAAMNVDLEADAGAAAAE
ncbi:hypothetical protein B0H15DRAFT_797793 [Mycena belliarum]|uniref:DUF6532 domain-containing protein n=1 Tax=Mycena belliarum TaxID=1033014 RepID=A0AAD6UDT5_9AGAR|nr:hypothetical protein B0H15DRAFT_797793 [Mycena belliae]